MKEIPIKAICGAVLAAILLVAAGQTRVSGNGKSERLVGTWRTQGTVVDCQTGAAIRSFLGINSFLPGGVTLSTGASNPALTSNGYGVWAHTEGGNFTNTTVMFRFNADGSFAGTQKITRMIELDSGADSFMSTNSVEIADAGGNVVAKACSTETAHRLE